MMFHFLFFLLFHFYFFSISSSYCSKSFQIKHLNNLPSYSTLYNTNSKFTIPSIKLPTINLFKSNIKEKNHEEISSKVNNNHTLDLKKINSTISYSIDPEKEKQLLQDLGNFSLPTLFSSFFFLSLTLSLTLFLTQYFSHNSIYLL